MDKQQKVLSDLQESVQYTYEEINNDANRKNLDKVEMLQDKFDALLQIIETQAHRVRLIILVKKLSVRRLDFVLNVSFI